MLWTYRPLGPPRYTHMFLACLLTLWSEHYQEPAKGILKYLEAGVQLFGLGMHLWICIMVSLKFPPGMLAKEGPQIRKSSLGTL